MILNLANFSSKYSYHQMLLNDQKIMIFDRMWYQIVENDKSNNFVIEKVRPKIIFITIFMKF